MVVLRFYATGLQDAAAIGMRIAGQDVPVLYAGPSGHYPGLDEINVQVPRSLAATGEVDVVLQVNGQTAGPVRIRIQ